MHVNCGNTEVEKLSSGMRRIWRSKANTNVNGNQKSEDGGQQKPQRRIQASIPQNQPALLFIILCSLLFPDKLAWRCQSYNDLRLLWMDVTRNTRTGVIVGVDGAGLREDEFCHHLRDGRPRSGSPQEHHLLDHEPDGLSYCRKEIIGIVFRQNVEDEMAARFNPFMCTRSNRSICPPYPGWITAVLEHYATLPHTPLGISLFPLNQPHWKTLKW